MAFLVALFERDEGNVDQIRAGVAAAFAAAAGTAVGVPEGRGHRPDGTGTR